MSRAHYICAVVVFLAIPVFVMADGSIAAAINPEIARGTRLYGLIFRLLQWTRGGLMLAMLLGIIGLWLATCVLLVRSKARSNAWLALAVLGPFSLTALTMLRNKSAGGSGPYDRFVQAMNWPLRVLYEGALFAGIWIVTDWLIDLKIAQVIRYQAFMSGRSIDEIIAEHEASGGMWAFSEGMETMYLFMLIYLVWPLCFDIAARLPGWRGSSKNA